ncbi:MAG TPA: DUF190 domain-containing protein [Tepidisphaeraceae bacterium]|nr:DUF190 domain-containing protein [Tepidisphaeraceae bacterium]
MSLSGEQILLRVYLQSADRAPHTPTYERLVKAARAQGTAGCTVLKGIAGMIGDQFLHPKSWSIVQHAPVILEIVDTSQKIQRFIELNGHDLPENAFCTLERAYVTMYRHRATEKPNDFHLAAMLASPLSTIPHLQSGEVMTIKENGILLRVFAGSFDAIAGVPLHERIVQKSREFGLTGAVVLRGTEGFGAHSVVHKQGILDMSTDLPTVTEIIGTEAQIRHLLPYLEEVVKEGMITLEYVNIINHRMTK